MDGSQHLLGAGYGNNCGGLKGSRNKYTPRLLEEKCSNGNREGLAVKMIYCELVRWQLLPIFLLVVLPLTRFYDHHICWAPHVLLPSNDRFCSFYLKRQMQRGCSFIYWALIVDLKMFSKNKNTNSVVYYCEPDSSSKINQINGRNGSIQKLGRRVFRWLFVMYLVL